MQTTLSPLYCYPSHSVSTPCPALPRPAPGIEVGNPAAEARSRVCGQGTPTRNPACPDKEDRSVLVVGTLSFLGSRLAAHLSGEGWEVTAVSQDGDILPQGLIWYRKDQLESSGVEVKILNFTNETVVTQLVKAVTPRQVVYIPPGLDSWEGHVPDSAAWCRYLAGFVVLMEALRDQSRCTRILLASRSKHLSRTSCDSRVCSNVTVLGAWMESFELTLSAYHHLYHFPIVILKTDGLYGPWSDAALSMLTPDPLKHGRSPHMCWYVGDVVWAIQSALSLDSDTHCEVLDLGPCEAFTPDVRQTNLPQSLVSETYQHSWQKLNLSISYTLAQGTRKSLMWARAYAQHQSGQGVAQDGGGGGGEMNTNEVVFTSYFTTSEDSQRQRMKSPNRFRYMMNWFLQLKQLNLHAVVFHDNLDTLFRHRLRQQYSHISFEFVPSLHGRSTNDARFYAYLNYLERHPEFSRVLLTDISDVSFQMNPFDLMTLLGRQWLYVGTDIDIFPSMRTMPWIRERLQACFGNFSLSEGDLHSLMDLDTVYNAGVIGGSRDVMLALLHRITEYLDTTPAHLNCNMPAVNFAIHKHFFHLAFTGFPLTSRFLRRQTAPKGVYIVHK